MTNDLSATASTPAEEALPVRKRATVAETRLTPAEWGLLSILTLMQFSVTIDFIIIAPLGPQLMRVFGIDTAQFGWTVAAYAFGAGLSSFSAAFFLDRFDRKRALLVLFTGSRSVRFAARWHQGTMRCLRPDS
jgi:predicted MFS family arabinose efflux permease